MYIMGQLCSYFEHISDNFVSNVMFESVKLSKLLCNYSSSTLGCVTVGGVCANVLFKFDSIVKDTMIYSTFTFVVLKVHNLSKPFSNEKHVFNIFLCCRVSFIL